jgi:hypothetical protein
LDSRAPAICTTQPVEEYSPDSRNYLLSGKTAWREILNVQNVILLNFHTPYLLLLRDPSFPSLSSGCRLDREIQEWD